MTGIQADHREIKLRQLVPVPGRQRTALQADAGDLGRPGANSPGDRLRCGRALALPECLAACVDDTDRGLLQRHVQSNILFHVFLPRLPHFGLITADLSHNRRAPARHNSMSTWRLAGLRDDGELSSRAG